LARALIDFEGDEDLRKIQEEKYRRALRNLITGITPPEDFGGEIPKRPVRGGTKVEYVPGYWFDAQANALFGHLWSYEVRDKGFLGGTDKAPEHMWVLGRVTIHVPGKTVVETFPDGHTIETRYDSISVVKEQFGSSEVKKSKETGKPLDYGDDLKSAATDSKKKCLTNFGFAADVYGGREKLEEIGPSASQLLALYKAGEKAGKDKNQVDEYVTKKYGSKPEELEIIVILGLIQEFRKQEKEAGIMGSDHLSG